MNLYPKNSGRATHEVAPGHAHVDLVGQRTCQTLAAATGTWSRSPERFVAQRGQYLGDANQTVVGQTQAGSVLERDYRNPATDQQHRDIACYAGTRAGSGEFASSSQEPF